MSLEFVGEIGREGKESLESNRRVPWVIDENEVIIGSRTVTGGAYHEIAHSATYSTATMQPKILQYISHLSISSSEAGRCERVL